MAEKNFNARFKQKHDVEANWAKASFVPLAGEFIIYDADENNPLPRIKVGDGETQINNLSFVDKGKMTYKGEVTELPSEASEGDVYKIELGLWIEVVKSEYGSTNNIYETSIEFVGGSSFCQAISDAITNIGGVPKTIKITGLGDYEEEQEIIFLAESFSYHDYSDEGGPSDVSYIHGKFISGVLGSVYLENLTAYLENSDVKNVSYIYHNNEWIELGITQEYVDSQFVNKAKKDLSNVDDAVFKAKGIDSGLGTGTMNYKGEVEELPETTNEGDVYKLVVTDYNWSTHKSVINDNSTLILNAGGLQCDNSGGDNCAVWDEVNNWVIDYNNYNSFLIKLYANGQQYIFKSYGCGSGDVPEEAEMGYTQYWYISVNETISMGTEQTLSIGDTVEIYLAPENSELMNIKKSYVYHNGEWDEIGSEAYDDSGIFTKISELEDLIDNKANTTHYHSASNITSGTFSVSRGGTGKSSWNTNRLIYPSGSTTLTQLALPTEESILTQTASGAPYWTAISTLVTQSDMETYINETILGGEW